MQTHREIEFGDGTYRFALGMGQIIAIEEKCGARIGAVHAHILRGRYVKEGAEFGYGLEGDYGAVELIEICRQGLIGGKGGIVDEIEKPMSDHLATHLVRTYLHPDNGNPLIKAWDLATAILQATLIGYEPVAAPAQKKSQRKTRAKATSSEVRSSATAS